MGGRHAATTGILTSPGGGLAGSVRLAARLAAAPSRSCKRVTACPMPVDRAETQCSHSRNALGDAEAPYRKRSGARRQRKSGVRFDIVVAKHVQAVTRRCRSPAAQELDDCRGCCALFSAEQMGQGRDEKAHSTAPLHVRIMELVLRPRDLCRGRYRARDLCRRYETLAVGWRRALYLESATRCRQGHCWVHNRVTTVTVVHCPSVRPDLGNVPCSLERLQDSNLGAGPRYSAAYRPCSE